MKKIISLICIMCLCSVSFAKTNSDFSFDEEELFLMAKGKVIEIRMDLVEAKTDKEYRRVIFQHFNKLSSNMKLKQAERELLESRLEAISDMEMKPIFIEHLDQFVTSNSVNGLLLVAFGVSLQDRTTGGWILTGSIGVASIVLGIFLSPWYLNDLVISDDV